MYAAPPRATSAESARIMNASNAVPPEPVFGVPGIGVGVITPPRSVGAETMTVPDVAGGRPFGPMATAAVGVSVVPVPAIVAGIVLGATEMVKVLPTGDVKATLQVRASMSAVPPASVKGAFSVIPVAPPLFTLVPRVSDPSSEEALRMRQSERLFVVPPFPAVIVRGRPESVTPLPECVASSEMLASVTFCEPAGTLGAVSMRTLSAAVSIGAPATNWNVAPDGVAEATLHRTLTVVVPMALETWSGVSSVNVFIPDTGFTTTLPPVVRELPPLLKS